MDIPKQAMKLGRSLAEEINRTLESGDPNVTATAVIITEGMGEPTEFCILIKRYTLGITTRRAKQVFSLLIINVLNEDRKKFEC